MSGISGFYHPNASYLEKEKYYTKLLQDMHEVMAFRGPDGHGTFLTDQCGLSHARLATIDLNTGSQPMEKTIDNNVYAITHNGEIYNYKTLREDLILKGHTFKTESDTEVILEGFLEYGPSFVKKLDGIFSTAIYNSRYKTIHLFRDSFGTKPLFYTFYQDTLIFGSEIKALFAFPNITPSVGRDGLNEIFSLGPARSVGSGVYDGIFECKPGCYLTYNKLGFTETNYWQLESAPHYDTYEQTIEKTSYLVTNAIRKQMIGDVDICTFLSGGIDSSIVSSVISHEMKKRGKKLHTFSFDFTENDLFFKPTTFQPSTDRPYAEKMVAFLDSEHHFLECDTLTQADLLEASMKSHDLPCMADIDSSLHYFCSQVSPTHKIVLTGECADEIFGGYPWFHKEESLSSNTFPWTPSLEPRKQLLDAEFLSALNMDDYVQNTYYKAINEINLLPGENETETKRRQIAYLNIRYFMQTLLNRMERTSMQAGLAARMPFADRELVSYVFNVPWEMKAKDGLVKNLLRQSTRGLLPEEILFRRKSPYPKTYHPGYEQLLASRLSEVLDGGSPLNQLLNPAKVKQFLDSPKDYGKPWYGQLMAGPQMIAYLLQIHYWMVDYQVKISF